MATSRTGTTTWLKVARQAKAQAQANGQTTCPECGTWLDWERSRQPNSPEADHIISHANGGPDHITNTRIICRLCNQRLGAKTGRRKKQPPPTQQIQEPTRFNW